MFIGDATLHFSINWIFFDIYFFQIITLLLFPLIHHLNVATSNFGGFTHFMIYVSCVGFLSYIFRWNGPPANIWLKSSSSCCCRNNAIVHIWIYGKFKGKLFLSCHYGFLFCLRQISNLFTQTSTHRVTARRRKKNWEGIAHKNLHIYKIYKDFCL